MALAPWRASAEPPETHWSLTLRNYIDRVAQVDWRLGATAQPLCSKHRAALGLRFDSLDAYAEGDRAAVSTALGLNSAPQISSVAIGSPAQHAAIVQGDEIVKINRTPITTIIAGVEGNATADRIETAIARLPINTAIHLTLNRNGEEYDVDVMPETRCPIAAIVAVNDGLKAYSDRTGLAITTGLRAFFRNDDELALIFGHELAHVLLRDRHDRRDIGGKHKEDEADILGARLAGCSGYDLKAGTEFWKNFDRARPLSFLPSFSHRSGKKRFKILDSVGANLVCENLAEAVE